MNFGVFLRVISVFWKDHAEIYLLEGRNIFPLLILSSWLSSVYKTDEQAKNKLVY